MTRAVLNANASPGRQIEIDSIAGGVFLSLYSKNECVSLLSAQSVVPFFEFGRPSKVSGWLFKPVFGALPDDETEAVAWRTQKGRQKRMEKAKAKKTEREKKGATAARRDG